MNGYSEFRFYSPIHDCDMARISMAGDQGQEYFALIEATEGKHYREARNHALEQIDLAIRMHCEPGEVVIE